MDGQFSIIELIGNASFTVQLVMALLAVASMLSWAFIFERALLLNRARTRSEDFEDRFWSGVDLGELYAEGEAVPDDAFGAENIFRSGFAEYSRLVERGAASEALMDGAQRAMRVGLLREQEKLEAHLPFLATVASTSPYLGLFGTVWGVMNSFRGLASTQQATLATVAPGIAEALVATAMGLFAAIPAVIAYNRYSTRADSLINRYSSFAEEFSSILHRQVQG